MESKILATVEYKRVTRVSKTASERIVKETAMTIRIDGQPYATAMMLAALEKEYVYGHLLTQGIIQSVRDVRLLTVRNNVAEVALVKRQKKTPLRHKVSSTLKIKSADIFNCVKAILKSPIFIETEAVHSAGLFLRGVEPIYITEGLGRQHALDKIIGYGLLHDVDFSQALAASTGRLPSEMIQKCRNVNIPVIVTKSVPTTLAVELAEKAGITIVGLVRDKNMIIYSHPERII
jgi:FdhD protein